MGSIEKRIESLERSRQVSVEQRVRTIAVCSTEEPSPTDEEIEIARAEFIDKYGDSGLVTVDTVKGITSARVNGEYVELPYSDRLRQLRQKRIDSWKGPIDQRPFFERGQREAI